MDVRWKINNFEMAITDLVRVGALDKYKISLNFESINQGNSSVTPKPFYQQDKTNHNKASLWICGSPNQ